MMDYIKSRFSGNTIYWVVFMTILPLPASIIFGFKVLRLYNFNIKSTLLLFLFSAIFLFVINFLKHVKYIIIEGEQLKYYSILKPFGQILNLNNYLGKIILSEKGSAGAYKVVYLIDKQNRTSFKIMGLHYKNFDDVNDAIKLRNIKFSPTKSQYFKLLFFEKITIENKNTSNNETKNIILELSKTICIVGIILFILGFLLKEIL